MGGNKGAVFLIRGFVHTGDFRDSIAAEMPACAAGWFSHGFDVLDAGFISYVLCKDD